MGKAKLNIPMCAALILLLLTMISCHLTSGLYARYTGTADGAGSARVAKFQVLSTPTGSENILVDCNTQTDGMAAGGYPFTVTNNSEVSVCYTVEVRFDGQVPENLLSVSLDGGDYVAVSDSKALIPEVFQLDLNDPPADHQLMFAANQEELTGMVQEEASVSLALDFQVIVHAEQID